MQILNSILIIVLILVLLCYHSHSSSCESNSNTQNPVKVYHKGDFIFFEQNLEDASNHVRISITLWITKDGCQINYCLISNRNGAPGNSSGHLFTTSKSPLNPNALKGFIPKCYARQYVEDFLYRLNKETGTIDDIQRNESWIHDDRCFTVPSSPVSIYASGPMIVLQQEYLNNGGKYSIKASLTKDKKYLEYILILDYDKGEIQGVANGSFWGNHDSIPPELFHGIIPKCNVRLKLECILS